MARDAGYVLIDLAKVCRPAKIFHSNIADIEYFNVDEKLVEAYRFTGRLVSVY